MKNSFIQPLKLCAVLLSLCINLTLLVAIDTGFSVPVAASSAAHIKL